MQLTDSFHIDLDVARRRQQTNAWAKAVLLLAMGLYFVWVIASGNLPNYINERFAWLSYVAAAVLLLLGAHGIWRLLRPARSPISDDPLLQLVSARQEEHRPISWGVLAIVAFPLVLGTLIPSRPLGAESVSSISTSAVSAANVAEFQIDPLQRNVLDWLRVFNSSSDFSEFNGERADLIGFMYREPTFGENQFMIARFTVSCCVADASALGVPAHWAETATVEQGQWIRVQGVFQVGSFRDNTLPILQVESVELIDEPAHPYLYP
ncbi:MAG: TIGR03943 family protein [Chloroflexota bacterium]|nr:TIGR03943 family protein [Chloroflexota bacterium]